MSHESIKYIAYFDTQDSKIKRNFVTSAANKLEYIAKVIASTGKKVDIISISEVTEDKFHLYRSEKKWIADGVNLCLPFSWGGNNVLAIKLKRLWHPLRLFFYLLFNCVKEDKVVVYHSLGYFNFILWAKKLKGFKLVLEVEEIYSDVSPMSSYWRNLEFKMFDIADSFILSNDLLDAIINKNHKPSTVVYGTYHVEPKRVSKFNDGKIHIVYAGTFDHNKVGAKTAIQASQYLPSNYHIHICGFGTEEDTFEVKRLIADAQIISKSTITYDGLKKGSEFIEFLQSCHIGLSTQNPKGEYNDTSFPSKVLTYMANGLSVVSIRIPVLEKASIAKSISFYDVPDGVALAKAIVNCRIENHQESLLRKLETCLIESIKCIL